MAGRPPSMRPTLNCVLSYHLPDPYNQYQSTLCPVESKEFGAGRGAVWRERGKAGKERGKKQVKSEKERENCCQNEGADANHVEIAWLNLVAHPSPPTHLTGWVVGHHLLQFFHIVVTIATLVEAKSPVRWHVRATNHLLVLLNYCLRFRTKKEVEI